MAQSTKNENKETKKVAHKGGIYKVLRTTTYKGKTIIAGQQIKLVDAECKNRNLKKVGEFELSAGFDERVSSRLKDYVQEDNQVISSNSSR